MRDQSATIDLGLIGPGPDDPALQGKLSRRHWAGGRGLGWWPAALVTAVLVLAHTAATPPQPWLVRHFTVPGGHLMVLDERALYIARGHLPRDATLTAYEWDTGAVRWSIPLGLEGGTPNWIAVVDGTPLVITASPDGARQPSVTAFQPETGRERWTSEGYLSGYTEAGVLLHDTAPESGDRLISVDIETGDRRWSYPVSGDWVHIGVRDEVLRLDPHHRLVREDAATGTRLAAGPRVSATGRDVSLQLVGSRALLTTRAHRAGALGPVTLVAFDVDTLAREWATTLPTQGWLTPCGPLICVGNLDVPRALDPTTGAVAWSADWLVLGSNEWADFWRPTVAQLSDYLVLSRHQRGIGAPASHGWLIDAATGQPVLELPGWEVLNRTAEPVEPVLVRYRHGTAWVARVRPDLSGLRVLGSVEAAQSQCQVRGPHLACRTGPDRALGPSTVEVWRLRG